MPKKRFNAEQIVTLLRQIDVLIAQGSPLPSSSSSVELHGIHHFRNRSLR